MEWYILALMSAFIFGVSEVLKKKVLKHEHTLQFTTTYYLVCFVFLLVLLPRVNLYLTGYQWLLIIVKSVFLSIAAFMIFKLLRHYEISEIIPLKNMSPAFLVIFGFLLLSEKPSLVNISGILLLIIGTYVIEADHKIINLKKPLRILKEKKIILLLVYLVFISFCAVIDKAVVSTVDIYSYYFFQMMFITAIFISIKAVRKGGLSDIKTALSRDWAGLVAGALMLVVSDILYLGAVAIPSAMVVLVIPIRRLSTIVAAFIGGELFHEAGLKIRLSACLIMVMGAWLVIL